MVHFLHVSSVFHADRRDCARLLTVLLIGSLMGALFAKLQSVTFLEYDHLSSQTSCFPIWLRVSLFPCLLAVSFLVRRSFLFYVLFFLKGLFVSFSLCLFAVYGVSQLVSVLPAFFLSVLLLPVHFCATLFWLQAGENAGRGILFLLPVLLLSFLGALFQTSMVS